MKIKKRKFYKLLDRQGELIAELVAARNQITYLKNEVSKLEHVIDQEPASNACVKCFNDDGHNIVALIYATRNLDKVGMIKSIQKQLDASFKDARDLVEDALVDEPYRNNL